MMKAMTPLSSHPVLAIQARRFARTLIRKSSSKNPNKKGKEVAATTPPPARTSWKAYRSARKEEEEVVGPLLNMEATAGGHPEGKRSLHRQASKLLDTNWVLSNCLLNHLNPNHNNHNISTP